MISPWLRWTRVDDCVFLLDLASGEYFGLDGEAAREWHSLLMTPGARLDGRTDSAVIHHAVRRGWLVDGSRVPEQAPPSQRQTSAQDWRKNPLFNLLATNWSMRHRGFGKTYARIVDLDRRSGLLPDASVRTLLADFHLSETLLVSRLGFRDCLPRSLALFAFLRANGVSARHRIGVKRFPFSAHAWVENEGRPLGADGTAPDRFNVIAEIGM